MGESHRRVATPDTVERMPADLQLLIPPSEGKAPDGEVGHGTDAFAGVLGDHRAAVIRRLAAVAATLDAQSGKKLFGATGFLLQRAMDCAEELAAGDALVLPAWQRYTGVVWTALDPASLDDEQRSALLIPSAIYGLNRGTDEIADYRLTLGARLDGVGNLAASWRRLVTEVVEEELQHATVVDLLPSEHRGALDVRRLEQAGEYITVDFVRADGHGAAGHAAKAIKGTFARMLLEKGLSGARRFRSDGWRSMVRGNTITVIAP